MSTTRRTFISTIATFFLGIKSLFGKVVPPIVDATPKKRGEFEWKYVHLPTVYILIHDEEERERIEDDIAEKMKRHLMKNGDDPAMAIQGEPKGGYFDIRESGMTFEQWLDKRFNRQAEKSGQVRPIKRV